MQMNTEFSRHAWPAEALHPEAKKGPPLVTRFPPGKVIFCGSVMTEDKLHFLLHLPDDPT